MRREVPIPARFEDWGDSFGSVAPRYEAIAFARGCTDRLGASELDEMHSGLGRPDGRSAVLDIGAGTGRVSRSLTHAGWQVTAMDASPAMLAELARAVPSAARVHGMLGDPLPFADDRFDAVVALRVLKYVAAPGPALAEIARVLRPGGVAVIEWTNSRSIARVGYRGAPICFLHRSELEHLARAAGLDPRSWRAGSRLPHRVWQAASGRAAAGALRWAESALGVLTAPFGPTAAARSVVTTFVATGATTP